MVDFIASLSRYETWLLILGAYVILQYLWTATGLRQFPGPRLAKFSRLWIFFKAATVSGYKLYPSLHHKYGPIVRLGPKQLSVSDPRLVPLLYANNVRWDKVRARQP
jgi:hypothetical protein